MLYRLFEQLFFIFILLAYRLVVSSNNRQKIILQFCLLSGELFIVARLEKQIIEGVESARKFGNFVDFLKLPWQRFSC